MLARDVPVLPDPDRARDLLRRELLDPAYQTDDLLRRLLDLLDRVLSDGVGRAGAIDGLGLALALLVVLSLVLAVAWLASRVRSEGRRPAPSGRVLEEDGVVAAELRRRAEAALLDGRLAEAVVEGFRALTLRQYEAGVLPENPASTVAEVASALAAAHPERAQTVRLVASLFDAVRYGGRTPTVELARGVLALDDDLAARAGARR
ncbi:hypothetical protein GCM10022215_20620 [Nocardioides fonticola]|uniref:Protein-glutamine gamma-glutamyltransferase-like C-terminal domain-containing protein n=1 Tax=Nocardioides fonticola TaxID=450363 RepID=A0ABP7XJW9_9ACTN